MLSYITKVDNFHLVSVNGRNVKVSQTLAGYEPYQTLPNSECRSIS